METLTKNTLQKLLSAIACQTSLEAVLKIFIVTYPKYLKKYYMDLRYQAIGAGMEEYKNSFKFELLVDECQRKYTYPMLSLLYTKYQQATSLAEQLWYKNKIRSQFKQYVKNDKQFEQLNEYFLSETESQDESKLASLEDLEAHCFEEEVEEILTKITDLIEEEYFNSRDVCEEESPKKSPKKSTRKSTPTALETKITQPKASKTASKTPQRTCTKKATKKEKNNQIISQQQANNDLPLLELCNQNTAKSSVPDD